MPPFCLEIPCTTPQIIGIPIQAILSLMATPYTEDNWFLPAPGASDPLPVPCDPLPIPSTRSFCQRVVRYLFYIDSSMISSLNILGIFRCLLWSKKGLLGRGLQISAIAAAPKKKKNPTIAAPPEKKTPLMLYPEFNGPLPPKRWK